MTIQVFLSTQIPQSECSQENSVNKNNINECGILFYSLVESFLGVGGGVTLYFMFSRAKEDWLYPLIQQILLLSQYLVKSLS